MMPPRAPRSTIPPACVQEKAWIPPSAVALLPTTWPLALPPSPKLNLPPRVPRSTIPPACVQEKACSAAFPVMLLDTTTWPLGITWAGTLMLPPSVPRSIAVAVAPAARASPVEAPPAPIRRAATTTAPKVRIDFNSLPLCLGVPERRVELAIAREARAGDVAACVDGLGEAVGAAERAEVDHPAGLSPGEGVEGAVGGDVAEADHLTARVHVVGEAHVTAEG